MKYQDEQYTLPDYWACYLFYGDFSGLNDSEIKEIDAFVESLEGAYVVDKRDDKWFAHRNDANNIGTNVSLYTFRKDNG